MVWYYLYFMFPRELEFSEDWLAHGDLSDSVKKIILAV